jgi:hypothetical protein
MPTSNSPCQVRAHKTPQELMSLFGKPLSEVDKAFAIQGQFKDLTAPQIPSIQPPSQAPKFKY